jgi:hypothetical protein
MLVPGTPGMQVQDGSEGVDWTMYAQWLKLDVLEPLVICILKAHFPWNRTMRPAPVLTGVELLDVPWLSLCRSGFRWMKRNRSASSISCLVAEGASDRHCACRRYRTLLQSTREKMINIMTNGRFLAFGCPLG